eukprot:TRINITY_DN4729_c0_g1_i1.p1 TRINITY_DN4729_c0_g1~~TRINITY_DN4729_c0_g1_i1.p1  ORF type:complete len:488 (-),score=83.76 TRINITY_DN4729_c0_g1_i1:6-1469(-)
MSNQRSSKEEVAVDQGEYDVVVVGGGLAGLTCARRLKEQGRKVVVLEARDRLGGRTESVKVGDEWFDVGGQWIGVTQDRLKALAQELGVKTFPQFYKGKNVIVDGNSRSEYSGTIPWYPSLIPYVPSIATLLDLDSTLKNLDKLAVGVSLDEPWNSVKAKEYDNITFHEWQKKNMWTQQATNAVYAANGMLMAAETNEISFLYFLYYIQSSGGSVMRLLDVTNGAQEERFEGGAQQLSEGLGKIIGNERVILSSPVRRVEQDEKGVSVYTRNNRKYKAKYVVIAIPPIIAGRLEYSPPLPALRDALTQRMPMGSVIKTLTMYKTAWWRTHGYSGQVVSVTYKAEHPILSSFDDTDNDLKLPCLVGFIVGSNAREWSLKTEEERKQAVIKQYAEQFKIPEALEPIHYIDKVWVGEEFSAGCYVGLMAPGVMTTCGKALREPIGRIHFSGTETALKWVGYMEGALDSGENVAHRLGDLLDSPSASTSRL